MSLDKMMFPMMGLSKWATDEFAISDQDIPKTVWPIIGDYEHRIPLINDRFTRGFLLLYLPVSITNTDHRRNCIWIEFENATSKSSSLSSEEFFVDINDPPFVYTYVDHRTSGYDRTAHGKLSNGEFDSSIGGGLPRLSWCYIDGDELVLYWVNESYVNDGKLSYKGRYFVFE